MFRGCSVGERRVDGTWSDNKKPADDNALDVQLQVRRRVRPGQAGVDSLHTVSA